MERHGIVGCQLTDEGFIAVTFGGPQVEVAVGNGKGESSRVHEMGEDNRVDTTTYSKQHLLPSGEEVLLLNVCCE